MNPVNPADASYVDAARLLVRAGFEVVVHWEGTLDAGTLAEFDALIVPHAAQDAWEHNIGVGTPLLDATEMTAIVDFVHAGGGLVVLAETEQAKYGNNFAELVGRLGIVIDNSTVQDPSHAFKDVPTWILAELEPGPVHDLTARVRQACFYRSGTLRADPSAEPRANTIARTSAQADPGNAAMLMTRETNGGRVAVAADSDIFGDDSINDLDNAQFWLNVITWAAGGRAELTSHSEAGGANVDSTYWSDDDRPWVLLIDAIELLRPMQKKDGSLDLKEYDSATAQQVVADVVVALTELAPRFPHQRDQLAATILDLQAWGDGGFAVPDFSTSLALFRPDLHREDGIEHLAMFPMYTQNGNPNRNFEAVVTRTFWPDWLAEQEANTYDNPAFVPIEFVGFTKGYDTHCAVLFPETVAISEPAEFKWGGIFCDREAARFRVVARAASKTLALSLPPDADLLLNDQRLAQETFVLWDLIHDRTHSHGDLPFDPFMIKQRMPFWMYALEELRCDLNTFRQTSRLNEQDNHLGRFIRYAILFDRLFRFPITGSRVRNYDGLGGQIMFAWLHHDDVLRWTDNTLTIDWARVDESVVGLCDQVDALYHSGIDRSRLAQWIAAHQFVGKLVEPHPASVWAQGAKALPLDGELKETVDQVLPDEFPLNVFYEALRRKLTDTVEATAGITASGVLV